MLMSKDHLWSEASAYPDPATRMHVALAGAKAGADHDVASLDELARGCRQIGEQIHGGTYKLDMASLKRAIGEMSTFLSSMRIKAIGVDADAKLLRQQIRNAALTRFTQGFSTTVIHQEAADWASLAIESFQKPGAAKERYLPSE